MTHIWPYISSKVVFLIAIIMIFLLFISTINRIINELAKTRFCRMSESNIKHMASNCRSWVLLRSLSSHRTCNNPGKMIIIQTNCIPIIGNQKYLYPGMGIGDSVVLRIFIPGGVSRRTTRSGIRWNFVLLVASVASRAQENDLARPDEYNLIFDIV